MEHVTIYRKGERYAGWPASYGIWSWEDEIVVGFGVGYPNPNGGFHSRDRNKPFTGMQARSLDGGQTWLVQETPCRTPDNKWYFPGMSVGFEESNIKENAPVDCPGGINFAHPNSALMCARSGLRAGSIAWFYYSYDRCKTWRGPFKLPMFGEMGIVARTDYLVSSMDECTLFLAATKTNGDEGRPFCARTTDGAKTFKFVSWIGPEPEGFTIMPSSVRLSESCILVAVRSRTRKSTQDGKTERNWIDLFVSNDNGVTWDYVNTPVENTGIGGNPPAMIQLRDGRLCLTYGNRDAPYSIRARISKDGGVTWRKEITLRDDGGNHDIGYPRTVQRADRKVVTVYYFNDHPEGERYIAATIWEP